MVAPVADVAPRILGVANLPVDAVTSDAIRVVAVGRRGVKEHCDHLVNIAGKTLSQTLPVLENIAPVALIGVKRATLFVLDVNLKSVPWPAWIAVATTETQRQVFVREP